MKYRILSFLAIVSLLLIPATALASWPQDYLDPEYQQSSPPGAAVPSWPEHFVYGPMYLNAMFGTDDHFKWYSQSAIFTPANSAIARWNSEKPVGADGAQYTSSQSSAQVVFTETVCPNPAFPACTNFDQYQSVYGFNINWWLKATVYIQPSGTYYGGNYYNWTTTSRLAALTHEVGHLWGMGEQYTSSGGCNSSSYSIMDGLVANYTEGAYYYAHCDGIDTLTSGDKTRFTDYFVTGSYQTESYEYVANNGLISHNKDFAWMDWSMQYWWFHAPSPSGPWTNFHTGSSVDDNGSHNTVSVASALRVTSQPMYPNNYGLHNKYLLFCHRPTFNAEGSVGTFGCASFSVYWP